MVKMFLLWAAIFAPVVVCLTTAVYAGVRHWTRLLIPLSEALLLVVKALFVGLAAQALGLLLLSMFPALGTLLLVRAVIQAGPIVFVTSGTVVHLVGRLGSTQLDPDGMQRASGKLFAVTLLAICVGLPISVGVIFVLFASGFVRLPW